MRIISLFFVLLLVVGMTQWYSLAPLPAIKSAKVMQENWQMPTARQFDVQQALFALQAVKLWGESAAAAAASIKEPPAESRWQILGVMSRAAERFVVIKVTGSEPAEKQLKVGDRFPGGSAILAIGEDSICVLVNGKKRTLPIHKQSALLL